MFSGIFKILFRIFRGNLHHTWCSYPDSPLDSPLATMSSYILNLHGVFMFQRTMLYDQNVVLSTSFKLKVTGFFTSFQPKFINQSEKWDERVNVLIFHHNTIGLKKKNNNKHACTIIYSKGSYQITRNCNRIDTST